MFKTIVRLVAVISTALFAFSATATSATASDEPRFTTVSLSGHTLTAEQSITFSYALSGAVPNEVELRFVEESTGAVYPHRLTDVTESGTAIIVWNAAWPAGVYRLDQLRIFPGSLVDPPLAYRADGTIMRDTTVLGEHALDFTGMSFTLSGEQTNLMVPPSVSAASVLKAPIEVGDELVVSVTTQDEQPALGRVFVGWQTTQVFRSGTPEGATELKLTPPAGSHTTFAISVFDKNGAFTIYHRDGSISHGNTSQSSVKYYWLSPRRHSLDFTALDLAVRPKPVTALTAAARSGSVQLMWSQPAELGHRIVISPGGRVVTGGPGTANRSVTISSLNNGTPYSFSVSALAGNIASTDVQVTAEPYMGPLRVFGTGDRSKDGRADLWAAPTPTASNSAATWRIYQGAGGGKFKGTLTSTIPVTRTPLPGSATGRGPGAPLGALYLSGSELVEPTATGTRVIGRGFNVFHTIDASSDLTSDGIADLIGITPTGDFYLYTSTSTGAIGRGARLGGGWNAFQFVFSPGDFNGDTRSDVVGVDGLGKLWLYPGNGRGGFLSRVQIGSGWNGFASVLPMRDFSGDGKVDLGAITRDGALRMYPGNGRGGFLSSSQIGTGWSAFL